MEQSQLLAGASVADITPPLEVGLLTSSVKGLYAPFESVRLPLKARVLALKSGNDLVAIVSMDLLALNDTSVGCWENFKHAMSDIISPERIILTCTHTHSAPESVALSGLYLTGSYQDWLLECWLKIKEAIHRATNALKPCDLSVAFAKLENYSLQRRIQTPEGVIMSDSIQPIASELMNRKPIDQRVRTIRLQDKEGETIATVVHAVCHPVHEMCLPHISSDFPGEMCRVLETSGGNGMPMFLNGAAGDINPPTVSCGPEYAQRHGSALAELAQKFEFQSRIDTSAFSFLHSEIQLSARPEMNITNKLDALARLNAIRVGSLAIIFLPGEPFVETALEIERCSPFAHTIVVGYSENTIGYIPTQQAYREGGYEVGPGKWSFLEIGADMVIRKEAIRLLEELYNKNTAANN
jgi:hypothetical protein